MTIERSESFNHHGSYTPDKAHDGNYNTWYAVLDQAETGNFLKLFLSEAYRVGKVVMVSREKESFGNRMVNTEVRVYSSGREVIEMASCGIITG